jgi:2-dehydro-3-deoxygluconokinase
MDHAIEDVASVIEDAIDASRPSGQRVVGFGEAVLRLQPAGHERLERASMLEVSVGGPELNMVAGMVPFGVPVSWVSSLPDSPVGRRIAREAAASGVDTSGVRWEPAAAARAGIVFVESAPDPRSSTLYPDTGATSLSHVRHGTFDWRRLLDGAAVLHISGITLGLSSAVRAEVMEGVRVANARGTLVSFDLRYREDCWSEADARQAFMTLIPHVDVLFASRGGLRTFYGIEGSYESVLRQAIERLGVAAVSVSRKRAKGSRRLTLEAMAMGKNRVLAESASHDVEVVDRMGSSDAFAAGFLAGYLENPQGLTRAVALGAASCALAYTVPGELPCATLEEIEALASSGS